MLWTITVILFLLWLLGFIGFHILGAWIHLLLLVVIVMLILSLISGRRVL
ncbi:MAG: lmo0937 family membrane protein [Acidobacteriaceae bacterium]|nr:lmo0937 family membrane protein [Acidobacteriaceae bacterium]